MPAKANKRSTTGSRNVGNTGGLMRALLRLLYFSPMAVLFMERLWIPLEFENLAGYLDVEQVASTKTAKLAQFSVSTHHAPTLQHLTMSTNAWKSTCPAKMELVSNNLANIVSSSAHKIPRIIHQTARSKCVTPAFASLTKQWKLPGWSYVFHDEETVNRLMRTDFPEFPHLKLVLRKCVTNGTLKADLWRYLALWVYGGVYADLDTAPNSFNADSITATDDAFFVVEQYHILSQWFMAVSPRHPLMYYAVQHSLLNLIQAEDTVKIGAHIKTGPHALHRAFTDFRKDMHVLVEPIGPGFKPVWSGQFTGTNNRTITVAGQADNENEYVRRQALDQATKIKDYRAMGMSHFSKYTVTSAKKSGQSCLDAMLGDAIGALSPELQSELQSG